MSQTAAELNAATDKSIATRVAEVASAPKAKAPAKAAPKRPARKPAPKPAPAKIAVRKALTPKERYARPATATIVAYVDWYEKNVVGRKLTGPERKAAEMSITLYGAYQASPERKQARGY